MRLEPSEREALDIIEAVGGEVADYITSQMGRLCVQVFHHNADEMLIVRLTPAAAMRFAERYR